VDLTRMTTDETLESELGRTAYRHGHEPNITVELGIFMSIPSSTPYSSTP
jgi:hypothetical protein